MPYLLKLTTNTSYVFNEIFVYETGNITMTNITVDILDIPAKWDNI